MERDESGQRRFLRRILAQAAGRLEVEVTGEPVYGWHDRSIGAAAMRDGELVWLRATGEHEEWTTDQMWTGNQDAAALTGIPKPTVLGRLEWQEPPVVVAAEVMTRIGDPVCSPTPELRRPLDLPERWWRQLGEALARLRTQANTPKPLQREEPGEKPDGAFRAVGRSGNPHHVGDHPW